MLGQKHEAFTVPRIVQLEQLRDRCCEMMQLSAELFGGGTWEKKECTEVIHSFRFAGSPLALDLGKETTMCGCVAMNVSAVL